MRPFMHLGTAHGHIIDLAKDFVNVRRQARAPHDATVLADQNKHPVIMFKSESCPDFLCPCGGHRSVSGLTLAVPVEPVNKHVTLNKRFRVLFQLPVHLPHRSVCSIGCHHEQQPFAPLVLSGIDCRRVCRQA